MLPPSRTCRSESNASSIPSHPQPSNAPSTQHLASQPLMSLIILPKLIKHPSRFIHLVNDSRIISQPQVLPRRHTPQRICMPHPAPPALHTDNRIVLLQHSDLNGVHDAPFQSSVNVFLPGCGFEVGLGLVEHEGVDAAEEVGVLLSLVGGKIEGGVGRGGEGCLPERRAHCV